MKLSEGWGSPDGLRSEDQWTWFHANGEEPLALVVLSETPTSYVGHYVAGRMRPCDGDSCTFCERGTGRQARWVMCCVRVKDGVIGMLEVGKPLALQIRDWSESRGRLRGLAIELYRASRSKHSRIEIARFEGTVPLPFLKFPSLDVPKVLKATWATAQTSARIGRALDET